MSSLAEAPAVVFDLDGTLIHSRRDLAAAVNRLRGELGLTPLPVERVEAMVGEGARVLVGRALADAETVSLNLALERFLEIYDGCCLDTTRPYPGIADLVWDLAARKPLAVLTNKSEGLSRKILAHLDLLTPFRALVGGDTLPARKPDPAGIAYLARFLGVEQGAIVLVGDSRFDAETAAAAGCLHVHVSWGYGRDESVRADGRAESVERLAGLLGGGILSP